MMVVYFFYVDDDGSKGVDFNRVAPRPVTLDHPSTNQHPA
jgi:hypothetical protein